MMTKKDQAIPVTVLTGALGAGKTSVLNYILSQNHGFKIAVIMNEFGQINIDHQLLQISDEQVLEMSNGCICCSVRTDLLAAIENLFRRSTFDYIVIETTGLADPGPIAQTFLNLPELQRYAKLDSIVTVIDCEQIFRHIEEIETSLHQIECADFLLLSKVDLVNSERLKKVQTALTKINPDALQVISENGRVDLSLLLDVHTFDVNRLLAKDSDFLVGKKHHHHDEDIISCSFEFNQPFELNPFEDLIRTIGEKEKILRSKGIVWLNSLSQRAIFHGVNNRFTLYLDRPWKQEEERKSQLVFIGKNLDIEKLERCFRSVLKN